MLFLITGGTIDKEYDTVTAKLTLKNTHVPEILNTVRFTGKKVIQVLFLKDSLDITEDERAQIAAACAASPENKIVITHGTDTMAETARLLMQSDSLKHKTIVLTGAMVPYILGSRSDVTFNLGSAVAFAEVLEPGVYVAMNGQAFNAGRVRKDREQGIFVAEEQRI